MYTKYYKRLIDVILSFLGIITLTILIIPVGLLIYFEDKGSIFYIAPRLGKDGKVFNMYKFRTMRMNAPDLRNEDGSTYNSVDDIRLTKIGKFLRKTSLDEAPQVINVLLGDMSVIGPRPDLPEHFDMYLDSEAKKLEVRPGITGYNQAYYRNTIPWRERIQLDIFYIENISFLLDIKIFFKTAISVLKKESVFVPESSLKASKIKTSKGKGQEKLNI